MSKDVGVKLSSLRRQGLSLRVHVSQRPEAIRYKRITARRRAVGVYSQVSTSMACRPEDVQRVPSGARRKLRVDTVAHCRCGCCSLGFAHTALFTSTQLASAG